MGDYGASKPGWDHFKGGSIHIFLSLLWVGGELSLLHPKVSIYKAFFFSYGIGVSVYYLKVYGQLGSHTGGNCHIRNFTFIYGENWKKRKLVKGESLKMRGKVVVYK